MNVIVTRATSGLSAEGTGMLADPAATRGWRARDRCGLAPSPPRLAGTARPGDNGTCPESSPAGGEHTNTTCGTGGTAPARQPALVLVGCASSHGGGAERVPAPRGAYVDH